MTPTPRVAAPDGPRVLLLGGSGQIGGALKQRLRAAAKVWSPTSGEVDLRDTAGMQHAVKDFAPNVIVNAAAFTAVDLAETEPDQAWALNADAPACLARCARQRNALLVHFSSDYVFDGTAARPYREDDAPSPLGVYGRSKRAGELEVLRSGAAALVLRTSWVYGPCGKNFLLTLRRLALADAPLRIVADQIGAPSYCGDVALAVTTLLAMLAPHPAAALGERGGVYHLSNAGQVSWHGFASAILSLDPALVSVRERTVHAITTQEYPAAARRPPYSVLDNTRIACTFGVVLQDWRAALRRVLTRDGAAELGGSPDCLHVTPDATHGRAP
jgi:dTDP-4-dehydrorhamnose reductase